MKNYEINLASRPFSVTVPKHCISRHIRRTAFLVTLWTGFFLSWSAVYGSTTPVWGPAPISDLVEEGLNNNKELQSLEAQLESLRQEVSYAGSLDDPRIGFGVLNLPTDTFSFSQEPMTQKQISIAQKIPWFGKRSLRSQEQEQKVLRQQALINLKKSELARKIVSSCYELGFTLESLAINEKLSALVDQLIRVAETKYASGEGLQQNVLQGQVERSLLLEEKIVLEKNKRLLEDTINELLNRDTFSSISLPGTFKFTELDLDLEFLKEESRRMNPQVQVKLAELAATEVEVEIAKKEYLPNIDVMAAYGQRDDDAVGRSRPDFVSASVGFNIPLWHKSRQQPKLKSAQKKREAAEKSYANLIEILPHKLDGLVTEIHNNQENFKLYKEALILQADQWAHSALIGYEVGKVGFDTMINAQLRLLRLELKAQRYLFNFYQKRAELEELVGRPLSQQASNLEQEYQ